MKKFALTALLMLSSLGGSQAANLYSSNLANGLTLLGGTNAVSQGTIRFGVFPADFDFAANSEDYAALDAAFTQVYSQSGPITAATLNGFFDIAATYDHTASYEGRSYYDSASTSTDIAGEKVCIWVLNNVNPAVATQQAIFTTNQRWVEPTALVLDTFVSPDSGAPELVAHLGALANGSNIGGSASSHTTGGALIPVSGVAITTTPAATQFLVGTRVTFNVSVVEGTAPLAYQWRRDGVAIPGATGTSYTIASVGLAGRGNYDCLVSNTAGAEDSSDIFLNVVTARPTILVPPAPAVLPTGGALNLAVQAVGAGTLKYQWSKGAPIGGATSATLNQGPLSLADAGNYSVSVSNAPGAGTGSVSAAAAVVIVDQTPVKVAGQIGKAASLNAVAAGPGKLSYAWYLASDLLNPLVDGPKYAGTATKTLTIKALTLADSDQYVCRITSGNASQTTGNITLVVYDKAPTLAPVVFPPAIVGGAYFYQIPQNLQPDESNIAETFAAAPLPAGLKLDPRTGIISGIPTKAGQTSVKVTITNKVNKSETPQPFPMLSVAAFPAGIAGTYIGPVQPVDALGANLGGRLDNLIISPTGTVSGKLILGTVTLPIAGVVTVTGTDPLTATVSVALTVRRANAAPLLLEFDLDNNYISQGRITAAGSMDEVLFTGWRRIWDGKNTKADSYLGNYNMAIGLEEGDSNEGNLSVPQGFGYTSFSVKADGTFAFTGRHGDGESITGSTFLGPNGEGFLFQTLYGNRGAFTGDFVINTLLNTNPADNEIAGSGAWIRLQNNAAKLYRAGFNFEVTLVGGAYRAPASNTLLGLAAGSTLDLGFENANLGTFAQNPDTTVTVQASYKASVASVAAKTALTPGTAANGLFSGSFEATARKKTSFFGMIVPIQGVPTGIGYFLLDQAGLPATQLSGAVYLEEPTPAP